MGKGARSRAANAEKFKLRKEAEVKAAKAAKRNKIITIVICVVLVAAIVAGTVVNSFYFNNGAYLRNKTAVTVENNDLSLNAAEMTYFFENTYNNYKNYYGEYFSMLTGLEEGASLKDAMADDENTWFQSLMDSTKESLEELIALNIKGREEGFELSEEQKAVVDQTLGTIDLSTYSSKINKTDVRKCLELSNYAAFYKEKLQSEKEYTDAVVDEYFAENYRDYTTVDYRSFTIRYGEEVLDGTGEDDIFMDEDGEIGDEAIDFTEEIVKGEDEEVLDGTGEDDIFMSEDEEIGNEAEEVLDGTEEDDIFMDEEEVYDDEEFMSEGEDYDEYYDEEAEDEFTFDYVNPDEAGAFELAEKLAGAKTEDEFIELIEETMVALKADVTEDEVINGIDASLSLGAPYSEDREGIKWTFENSTEENTAYIDNYPTDETSGEITVYFLLKKPYTDDAPTVTVRHILLTEAVYGSAKAADEKAQAILDEWKNGEATEESFAALASAYTEDTGSVQTGGLYENITEGEMVEQFNDWIFDENRKPGDTDVVITDYGYHVMYFVGAGVPVWKSNIVTNMKDADYSEILEELKSGITINYDEAVLDKIPDTAL